MPNIQLALSEDEMLQLQNDHRLTVEAWPQRDTPPFPPTFEEWLVARVLNNGPVAQSKSELDDVYAFNAIEKLVTSLHRSGYSLAQVGKQSETQPSGQRLAQALTNDLQLDPQYTKRLNDLFEHYMKSPKEVADAAHVGLTNRAYGALTQAYAQLAERTSVAAAHLGDDRAIGRVEGAAAILVSIDVMDRATATKKTESFRHRLGSSGKQREKATWVRKMFGGNEDKE